MKIAFLVGQFPALSQTFILQQITALLDQGHDVEIFARRRGKDPAVHGEVERYGLLKRTCYLDAYAPPANIMARLASRAGLLLANFHKNPGVASESLNFLKFGKKAVSLQVFDQVVPFLKKGPYDILHCHFGPNGDLGILLRETGIVRGKVITTFHGYDVSSYTRSRGRNVYNELFMRGDLFLCVSDRIKKTVIELGCPEQKILVHRCGIDVMKYTLLPKREHVNKSIALLSIARLVEKKGLEDGIRAVAKLLKEYPFVEYRIVGDGPLKNDLQNLIEELQLGKHVTLLGWKCSDEVGALLRGSDILVAPSVTSKNGDEEGIPVTIMEAFAHGLPVVGTYHAGIPELVQDGVSGFLVAERAVDALAQALARLVKQPELRVAMGRNGRRFVEEHHDMQKLNDRLVKIYRQLLDGELPSTPAQLRIAPELLGVNSER